MTQPNPSIRSQAPMGRREWIISSLLTSGLVASMSQAQALAVCLPIDRETQDPPTGKNPAPRNQIDEITSEMVRQASWQSRVELTDAHCEEIAKRLSAKAKSIQALRTASIEENTPMASVFLPAAFVEPATRFGHLQIANPAPGQSTGDPNTRRLSELELPEFDPDTLEQVAFWTVEQLAAGLRRKLFTSEQLTAMYTERLKKYDPQLLCVVSYNQHAIESAKRADELLASGKDLGILHGIPWGAKDIISIPGMPTTWGAVDYQDRLRETMATVAEKIESAGAILLAKLTVGTLAWGDQWFGGMTRNPWDIEQGSSGSSAGSACAVVAGLCGFAIGSETLGSIVSWERAHPPAKRQGIPYRHQCQTLRAHSP